MNKRLFILYSVMICLFFIYTGYTYMDQTHQSALIVHPKQLQTRTQVLPSPHFSGQRQSLKKLGLSDLSAVTLSKIELDHLKHTKGHMVSHATYYQKITSKSQWNLSKKEYEQELTRVFQSKWPQYLQLVRVSLRLIDEGERKFLLVGEDQVDFSPANLKPTTLAVQYKQDFTTLSHFAQLTSASVTELNNHHPSILTKPYNPSSSGTDNKSSGFDDADGETNIVYQVHWKQPALFQDVAGQDFLHVTEFEIPAKTERVDCFVQQNQPHLSAQLSYDLPLSPNK
ncbi:MAG: hypothetical protein ACE3JK_04275 [Sporolactobacillus sp.]